MRGQFASMSRLLLFASIASLAVGVTAEPKYCGNGLWYPGGVCPSQPPPTPPPAPPPQGPSPEQKEQLLKEQLRQQQVRSEQLRHEAYTRAEEAGISAYRRGDYEAAVQYFERALEYDPYNLTIKHNIQRAREKLAEQNAPPPAHSSHAFDQLNAIANGDRAVVQAPRSSYSGNLGGTGAPYGARTGFDTVAPTTPIPFAFTKYLEPGTDPVIPPQRRTPAINALV
jgi:tetratricopeptide (TPR) repeat protein